MAREIPVLVRAAAGLAATVLDEARKLPETLPGLPVRLIGLALQQAMRVQQQYAGLVARGDELFTGIRGENEPGLATFDDDDDFTPAPSSGGFRESAFDRVDDFPLDDDQTDDEIELAALVAEDARETVVTLAEEAPDTGALLEEVLDEIAIDDLVADAPQTTIPVEAAVPEKAAAKKTAAKKAAKQTPATKGPAQKTAADSEAPPLLEPRGMTPAPAPAPAPSAGAPDAPAPAEPTPFTQTSLSAPATAPVDGYDFFSVAQLRGRLRGYAATTVEQLLDYEKAGLAREPYLRMLRNRLERLRSESA